MISPIGSAEPTPDRNAGQPPGPSQDPAPAASPGSSAPGPAEPSRPEPTPDALPPLPDTGRPPTRSRRRRIARGFGFASASVIALIVVLAGAFFVVLDPPVEPFDPVAWAPDPGLVVNEQRINTTAAAAAVALIEVEAKGPEDVAVDRAGWIYTGVADGRILRVPPGGVSFEVFADVGGRPLGLEFNARGDLLVANQVLGLQSVSSNGTVTLLADTADGERIRFANDLAVADDGTVYLTESNSKYNRSTLPERSSYSMYDFLEGRALGRLLRYDPVTRLASTVAGNMYFPNGVAVTSDQRAVLVVESTRYRITKVWVDGERAGTSETFLDRLPGIGDGITRVADGDFLVAMYDRVAVLDEQVLPHTWARQFVVRIPPGLLANDGDPLPGSILVVSPSAEVERHIVGVAPAPANVVIYDDGWLLGSLTGLRLRTMPSAWP